jgi:phosphatidylglycerol lysyltransferase
MTSEQITESSLARELILAYSWNPIAYQVLNPGIQHWFSDRPDALIGYIECGRIRVVAGAPVCDPGIMLTVAKEFEIDTERRHERVCYFHVGPRFVSAVRELPNYSFACIGSLPYWNPMEWHSILKAHDSLRYQIARARNKEITVSEMATKAAAEDPELHTIREEWLRRKHLPPLHFLIEPEIFGKLADRRLFVAKRNRHLMGYLLCTPMPNRNGWLFEQWHTGIMLLWVQASSLYTPQCPLSPAKVVRRLRWV